MKKLTYFALFVFLLSCKNKETATSLVKEIDVYDKAISKQDTCLLGIETMEGNRYKDITLGEQFLLRTTTGSDWQLEVYTTSDCSMKRAYALPENFSPDYPYFLADINYSNSRRMLGIRGYKDLFIIDLEKEMLSEPIRPVFPDNRLADAGSGVIQHLEVWEEYLVGVCQDWGPFVFSLKNGLIEPVKAVADHYTKAGDYRSLFLIENANGTYQAILPDLSTETGEFRVNTLFHSPRLLNPAATVYEPGSPYVKFQESSGKMIGVNLYTGALLPVIEAVQ